MSEQKPLSPWTYKPWWCQPWSILLVGTTIIASSWVIWHTLWVTVLVSVPISIWMCYFLLVWPRIIQRSGILEQYSQSTSGSIEVSERKH